MEVEKIADYLHPERLYYSEQYVENSGRSGIACSTMSSLRPIFPMWHAFPIAKIASTMLPAYLHGAPGHYFMVGDNQDNSAG